ncbi:MAG: hydantoinase/oxoprolinase family protein, partial [Phycisphaerales bacterium]
MPTAADSRPEPTPNGVFPPPWKIAIDTGGTFTDCVAVAPDGSRRRIKVLSSGRLRGVLEAVADGSSRRFRLKIDPPPPTNVLLGSRISDGLGAGRIRAAAEGGMIELDELPEVWRHHPPRLVEIDPGCSAPRLALAIATSQSPDSIGGEVEMRLATTRGTNALLERRIGRVALFITQGFEDLLAIGDQTRGDLFSLEIAPRTPLPERVFAIPGRLDAEGATVRPLDLAELDRGIVEARAAGCDTAAVAVLHAHRSPSMEHEVAARLASRGFSRVICSSDLSRQAGFLERTQAASVDASLDAVIRDFLREIVRPHERISILAMTSDGRLTNAARYLPVESLLSGPAAGAMGVRAIAEGLGLGASLGFDMGGTSTDVVRVDGSLPVSSRTQVGDVRLTSPCVAIETVAAGGGSICDCDDEGRLTVGPESAGAVPGPACYGHGGPLTVTDVNLLLGRLDEEMFGVPIFEDASRSALERLLDRLGQTLDEPLDADVVLDRLLAIADERMAGAIESVSTRQGFSPADHTLVAFGGAGGQHAAAIADRLGMRTIAFPAEAGLLSAVGLEHAALATRAERTILRTLDEIEQELGELADEIDAEACSSLVAQGVSRASMADARKIVHLRLHGQDESIELDLLPIDGLRVRFTQAFARQYGYPPPDRSIEVAVMEARREERRRPVPPLPREPVVHAGAPRRGRPMRHRGEWIDSEVYARTDLPPGSVLRGPALLADRTATAILPPGWEGEVRRDGSIVATHAGGPPTSA